MTARHRALWDELVFDAYDHTTPDPGRSGRMAGLPLDERRTLVMNRSQAVSFDVCITLHEDGEGVVQVTGERMKPYHDEDWWARNVQRFTGSSWRGDVRIDENGSCTYPTSGQLLVRQGDAGELPQGVLAGARSQRRYDPHNIPQAWISSEIVFNPEIVEQQLESWFESTLAHELGHALGFSHVDPSSGFVMHAASGRQRTWPDTERWLSQWAYEVGPNVQYPGMLRGTRVPALPFLGALLLALVLVVSGGRITRMKKS